MWLGRAPLLRRDVEPDARKVQVDGANRWVFVAKDHFLGAPGEQTARHRIAVVVGGHADPVAASEPDVLRFGRPVFQIAGRCRTSRRDRLLWRHLYGLAVADG